MLGMFGIDNNQNQSAQNVMTAPTPDMSGQAGTGSPSAPPMPNPTMTPPRLTLNPLPPTPQHSNSLQNVELEKKELMVPGPPVGDSSKVPSPTGSADDSLLDIKKQALQSLSPLVGQLDQSPEESFKTTMMLIQATDNPELIQSAYEAANKITDEKARAQALLDVVNEINYFTQHGVDVPKVT